MVPSDIHPDLRGSGWQAEGGRRKGEGEREVGHLKPGVLPVLRVPSDDARGVAAQAQGKTSCFLARSIKRAIDSSILRRVQEMNS